MAMFAEIEIIEIHNSDQLKEIGARFGIEYAGKGAIPSRRIAQAILSAGLQINDTDYFKRGIAFGTEKLATADKAKPENVAFTVNFRQRHANGGLSPVKTLRFTLAEIRELSKVSKGKVGEKAARAAVAAEKGVDLDNISDIRVIRIIDTDENADVTAELADAI